MLDKYDPVRDIRQKINFISFSYVLSHIDWLLNCPISYDIGPTVHLTIKLFIPAW